MSNENDYFYGDYHGAVNKTGVGLSNDNNHVEVGRIYPVISVKSSDVDRVVVFETDVDFIVNNATDVEIVTEKNDVVWSRSIDKFTIDQKHIEVFLPANTDDEKSTLGVRFNQEVKAQVTFKGKVFAYNKQNQIETIVNVPAE